MNKDAKAEQSGGHEVEGSRETNLSLPNPDYSRLGDILYGTEHYLSKARLLIEGSLRTQKEEGGMVVVGEKGSIDIIPGGIPGEFFALNWKEIPTEEYLEFELIRNGQPLADMVFVDKKIAEKHHAYFKEVAEVGVPVIIDKQPVGPLHVHPSGNLPSPGDFMHAFDSTLSGKKLPEFVATNEWIYSLLPTRQTPVLSMDEFFALSRRLNDQEQGIIEELSRKNNSDPINTARLKILQENCPKYSIGLYASKSNSIVSRRVA